MASFAARLQGGAFLSATPNAAYNFGSGDFTVEAWIRATGGGTILSRKGSSSGQGNGGWLLVLQPNGAVKLATYNGFGYYQVISPAAPVVDGQWHHVAAVRASGVMSIYVDGAPVPVTASGTVGTPADVTNGLRLLAGATDQVQEPNGRFTGELDELRLWNVARSAAQVQAWMGQRLTLPQSGLVGYWGFEDRSLADQSATGNAFAAQGSVDFTQPGAPLAAPSYAVRLASNAFLSATANAAYNFGSGDFTVEAWIRATGGGTLLSRKGSSSGQGNGGWLLVLQPNGAVKLATDSGFGYYQVISQAKPIVDGQWHHVAGVRSGGTLTIYVDGVAVAGSASGNTGSPTNVANGLRLLAGATDQVQEPYNRLNGDLDELRVWNVARTAQQVAATWNQPLQLPQQGLVGYWTFDAASFADSSPTGNAFAPQGAATLITPGAPLSGAPLAAPAVQQTAYDGTNVTASWSAVTGATGYTMTVYDGSTQAATGPATGTQGSVPAALDATKSYTLRVQGTASGSTGPQSEPATVIAGKPVISAVSYDGTSVTASWPPEVAGATGYTMTVYDGSTQAATGPATGTQGSVPAALDATKSYTLRVQGTASGSTGPQSEPATVIAGKPTGMQLDYDGTALVGSWEAVAGAPGYSAELLAGGAPVETQPATGTTVSFTQAMASGALYTARVRVSAPRSLGPWSDAATGPYLAAVSYVYDLLGRLTSMAMPGVTLGYTYDDAGNVLAATRTLPGEGNAPAGPTPDAPTP